MCEHHIVVTHMLKLVSERLASAVPHNISRGVVRSFCFHM